MNFILSTESTCDLSNEKLKNMSVYVIKMAYLINGEEYGGTTSKELEIKDFYSLMREGAKTSTSMINEENAKEYFESLLSSGKDILHISFAKACSGTYDNMKKVSDALNATHTNKIYVVDSKCESTAQGFLVELCYKKAKSGLSAKEVFEYAEDVKERINSLFTVDNLKYLEAGGRVSKATAVMGNILKIKPLLYVNEEGKLLAGGKVMGRKLSLTKLAEMTAKKITSESSRVYVSHCDSESDALFLGEKITALTGRSVTLENIGPVIGSHSGPGTVAVFFVGENRTF